MGVGVQRYQLNQTVNRERFIAAMSKVAAANQGLLSDWEKDFMKTLRNQWDDRCAFSTEWSPTIAQWQVLSQLAEAVGS